MPECEKLFHGMLWSSACGFWGLPVSRVLDVAQHSFSELLCVGLMVFETRLLLSNPSSPHWPAVRAVFRTRDSRLTDRLDLRPLGWLEG